MAEGLLRDAVKTRTDITVSSAGVSAAMGQPASWQSVQAMRELGIDISSHQSQPLNKLLVDRATHIFVMTRGHFEMVRRFFPESDGKVYLLGDFSSERQMPPDIPDPYGSDLVIYRECSETLRKTIPGLLKFIDPTPMTTPTSNPPRPLRIAIGSDHAGLDLKQAVHTFLAKKGEVVTDVGTQTKDSCDYNDFAERVAQEVISGRADLGVLMCSSGIGMSIMANRHPQVRAGLVTNAADAAVTRQHNNTNILCFGARSVTPADAPKVAVAVIVEDESGLSEATGGRIAAPIAQTVMRAALGLGP